MWISYSPKRTVDEFLKHLYFRKFVASYLKRWPDTVSLNVSPAGHFQSRSVLAVVLGNDDRVRRYRTVLLAEVILAESDLYCCAGPTHFGRYYLGRWFRGSQDWHFLLPYSLGTVANLRLGLNPEDVCLAGYQ